MNTEQIIKQLGELYESFTPANANTSFPLLNPLDDTQIGVNRTYQDVYVTLYSLYRYLAKRRDGI